MVLKKMSDRIGPNEALSLSGTEKKRFTEVSDEFQGRLRKLNLCKDALIYSRTWGDQDLFAARTPIPPAFPATLRLGDGRYFADEERLVIDFSSQNIISQYSNPLPPQCILLIRRGSSNQPYSESERAIIARCFHRLYCTLLAIKRTEIRSEVLVKASGETLDSFASRCLNLIDDVLVSYEAASIFVPHRRNIPYLTMPATTKGIYQTRGQMKRGGL